MTRRYYVTKTWHDFPEGGSFGTVVEADSPEQAQQFCNNEMAATYADSYLDVGDGLDVAAEHGGDWHTIDCFDLDAFIERHQIPAPTIITIHDATNDAILHSEAVPEDIEDDAIRRLINEAIGVWHGRKCYAVKRTAPPIKRYDLSP